LGIVLGSLLAVSSQAEDKKIKPLVDDRDGGVHTLTIISGPNRSIHYFSKSDSPSERAALRELERAENEANYADSLLALRQQYVTNERMMENRRNLVQMALYGLSTESRTRIHYSATDTAVGEPGNSGVLTPLGNGFGFGFPFGTGTTGTGVTGFIPNTTTTGPGFTPTTTAIGLPFPNTGFTATGGGLTVPATGFTGTGAGIRLPFGGTTTTGFGFPGFGGFSGNSFGSDSPIATETHSATSTTRTVRTLADGIGDEGKFKNEMVAMIAKQATPEYASQAARNFSNAQLYAANTVPKAKGIIGVAAEKAPMVKLTLKNGKTFKGKLWRMDSEVIAIQMTVDGDNIIREFRQADRDYLDYMEK
jgi:hypothetical protein